MRECPATTSTSISKRPALLAARALVRVPALLGNPPAGHEEVVDLARLVDVDLDEGPRGAPDHRELGGTHRGRPAADESAQETKRLHEHAGETNGVDVSEVFSQEMVTVEAYKYNLEPDTTLDLIEVDEQGCPWNFLNQW